MTNKLSHASSTNTNNKFTSNFLYQNYNIQSNPNPDKTASIVRNKISSFSSSKISINNQTESKIEKNNSHSISISSTVLSNNVNYNQYTSLICFFKNKFFIILD